MAVNGCRLPGRVDNGVNSWRKCTGGDCFVAVPAFSREALPATSTKRVIAIPFEATNVNYLVTKLIRNTLTAEPKCGPPQSVSSPFKIRATLNSPRT